jgi:hypothetical protein
MRASPVFPLPFLIYGSGECKIYKLFVVNAGELVLVS